MEATIIRIDDRHVELLLKRKTILVPKSKLKFDYQVGDVITIRKYGNNNYIFSKYYPDFSEPEVYKPIQEPSKKNSASELWGFIALIIIVSIIFGVTLHEAFWGIIATIAGICAICLVFGTHLGRVFAKWVCIVLGVLLGVLLIYQGITKKTGDEKQYNTDVTNCQNDTWRYSSAKTYYSDYSGYYYDENKVKVIYNDCLKQASENSKARNNWWYIEAGAGAIITFCAIAIAKGYHKSTTP